MWRAIASRMSPNAPMLRSTAEQLLCKLDEPPQSTSSGGAVAIQGP